MPIVSVIVPVYNAEKYISKCINSILDQSLKDFEIILINDGSEDKSSDICDEYSRLYEKIRVIHIKNSGPARARNIGIENARGKYIAFIDSDDAMEKQMLEVMVHEAKKNNADIVICNFNIVSFDNKIISKGNHSLNKYRFEGNKNITNEMIYKFYNDDYFGLPALWNKIYKRDFIISKNIRIDENLFRGEDFWFNINALRNANVVITVQDYLYNYYQVNENSIMHSIRLEQYNEWKRNIKKLLLYNDQFFDFDINYSRFYFNFIYKVQYFILNIMQSNILQKKEKRLFIINIIKDDFYVNAISYKNPKFNHMMRIVNKAIKYRFYNMAYFIYYFWSKYIKIKESKIK